MTVKFVSAQSLKKNKKKFSTCFFVTTIQCNGYEFVRAGGADNSHCDMLFFLDGVK